MKKYCLKCINGKVFRFKDANVSGKIDVYVCQACGGFGKVEIKLSHEENKEKFKMKIGIMKSYFDNGGKPEGAKEIGALIDLSDREENVNEMEAYTFGVDCDEITRIMIRAYYVLYGKGNEWLKSCEFYDILRNEIREERRQKYVEQQLFG